MDFYHNKSFLTPYVLSFSKSAVCRTCFGFCLRSLSLSLHTCSPSVISTPACNQTITALHRQSQLHRRAVGGVSVCHTSGRWLSVRLPVFFPSHLSTLSLSLSPGSPACLPFSPSLLNQPDSWHHWDSHSNVLDFPPLQLKRQPPPRQNMSDLTGSNASCTILC